MRYGVIRIGNHGCKGVSKQAMSSESRVDTAYRNLYIESVKRVNELGTENRKLYSDNESLRKRLSRVSVSDMSTSQCSITTLECDIDNLVIDLEAVSKEVARQRSTIKILRAQLKKAENERDAVRRELASERQRHIERTRVNASNQEELAGTVDGLSKVISSLKRRVKGGPPKKKKKGSKPRHSKSVTECSVKTGSTQRLLQSMEKVKFESEKSFDIGPSLNGSTPRGEVINLFTGIDEKEELDPFQSDEELGEGGPEEVGDSCKNVPLLDDGDDFLASLTLEPMNINADQ